MDNEVILEVKDLKTHFRTDEGIVKAVDGISFELHRGEILGIVGESGSGKSVTNMSIIDLIPTPPGIKAGGQVLYRGRDLWTIPLAELHQIRGNKIAMIFQDPMTSLNPFLKISTQMIESLILHQKLSKKLAIEKAVKMLTLAGIPNAERRIFDYPHQFSGGMRQRVMIAMALCCEPEILIADEPTSALDVTIQAQILELMKELTTRLGTALILITHSLGVVAGICDKVCVMYAGRIVESGTTEDIFASPKHPYTRGLINSVPRLDLKTGERLYSIKGQPPHMVDHPDACPFQPRCDKAMEVCKTKYPQEVVIGQNNHRVSCALYNERSAS